MSIRYAILGLLSRQPLTGYDLKKLFAEVETFYWTGNNNQVYRTLVELHKADLVTQEVHHQEDAPARKVYTITAAGQAALHDWLHTPPELPQVRNHFMLQLTWADQLDGADLDTLLVRYEEELRIKELMLREQSSRGLSLPPQTERGQFLAARITARWLDYYRHELAWVQDLRRELLHK
ncbi:MAG: PadR family transcriptional regulator [Chloroflexi bacterium]|nr:PadR family transcriptional regulator [Chloroflexota bacterium]